MEKPIKYYSRVTDDRKGEDIVKKDMKTGKEETVATFYDAGLKQAFLLFLNS